MPWQMSLRNLRAYQKYNIRYYRLTSSLNIEAICLSNSGWQGQCSVWYQPHLGHTPSSTAMQSDTCALMCPLSINLSEQTGATSPLIVSVLLWEAFLCFFSIGGGPWSVNWLTLESFFIESIATSVMDFLLQDSTSTTVLLLSFLWRLVLEISLQQNFCLQICLTSASGM